MSENKIKIDKNLMLYDSISFISTPQIQYIKNLLYNVSIESKIIILNQDYLFFDKLDTITKEYGLLNTVFLNLYFWLRDLKMHSQKCLEYSNQKYFKNINYHRKETHLINEVERVINYYDDKNKVIQYDELDNEGKLFRRVLLETELNKIETYYRKDGSCYLIKENYFDNEEQRELNIVFMLNSDSEVIHTFDCETNFIHYCMDILTDDSNSIISLEQICVYKRIKEYERKNIFKFYYVNQTIENQTWFKEINPSILDGLIFSTNLEKEFAITKLGKRTNYFVLPPSIQIEDLNLGSLSHDGNNSFAVKVTKPEDPFLEQILRAIRIAIDKKDLKSVCLNIVGINKVSDWILNVIESLNLKDYVNIKESANKQKSYNDSNFSITLNSRYDEGLDTLESLSYGCPVISFDSTFVSRELLDDGNNGFLVENNSLTHLSEVMSKAMSLPSEEVLEMKEKAYCFSLNYNNKMYNERCENLIDNIIKIKNKRNKVEDMVATLLDCGWNEKRQFLLYVQSEFVGEMNKKVDPYINLILQKRDNSETFELIGEVIKKDTNFYVIESMINFNEVDLVSGIWDLSLRVEYENSYFEKRVGHFKSENVYEEIQEELCDNKTITPYFTRKGENLSFKITRFINNEKSS